MRAGDRSGYGFGAAARWREVRAGSVHVRRLTPAQPKQVYYAARSVAAPCSWCGRAIGERAVGGVDEAYCSPECAQAAGVPGLFLG
jgi:hypothetical protein